MEKEYNRYYIKIRSILGINATGIHKELVEALGPQAPSYPTVARWVEQFNAGRENFKDNPRSGAPVTAVTPQNIELVRQLIESDPHVSYNDIEAETTLSQGSIYKILHESLNLKKVSSRWVPHFLTPENRQERVKACQENLALIEKGTLRLCNILTGDETWIYHRQIGSKIKNACWVANGQSPTTIVRRGRYEAKTMFCMFFRSSGPVLIHALDKGVILDNNYYIENCLTLAFEEVIRQRPSTGLKSIRLLHDGAGPHRHTNVKDFLTANGIVTIKHPPYSPDLAPCDFWFFDYIKKNLQDEKDQESLLESVTRIASTIDASEYRLTFEKWVERMKLCIEHGGDYFEHLIK